VASERQIAANRRNAHKSTGPRSGAGKGRASRNAYRHGLTLSITSSAAFAKQLDKLARKIAGDTADEIILERAQAAAQAELDLARVRRVKVGAFGDLDAPQGFSSVTQAIRLLNALERDGATIPEPIDSAAMTPSHEPDRSAEAMRRALQDLLKLDRYERRAAARRDRAVRDIIKDRIK